MLFNSYIFIFLFLPTTLIVFFTLGKQSPRLASLWLTLASFLFYGWWNPKYIFLLIISILFNYQIGVRLAKLYDMGNLKQKRRLLFFGVTINLMLLAYYKYTNFFITNLNITLHTHYPLEEIILPIGISFFTFTQIAFLVDSSIGYSREYNFIHYCLFVTYFPHLIAGPVLHHREMMPQFENPLTYRLNYDNIAIGLTIFIFGLFKKLILADIASGYSTPVFDAAGHGVGVSTLEAWGGALCYSLQLYFDFSGYTDMAIGSSRMFGVKIPINFYSPYKATSIIEFWRCWHISLSRFLRDYLYIPLGGNRRGRFRRYNNLIITMVLGGLWHGANWTFIIWGSLHGLYLLVNHAWLGFREWIGFNTNDALVFRIFNRLITFFAIVFAWVFFRSTSLDAAIIIIKGMFGFNGTFFPAKWVDDADPDFFICWLVSHDFKLTLNDTLFDGGPELRLIAVLLFICWFLPNTEQIFNGNLQNYNSPWQWKPNKRWLCLTIIIGLFSILSISDMSEFIYFQF